jgi:hypothetical protein
MVTTRPPSGPFCADTVPLWAANGGHLINWIEATTTRYRVLVGHAGLVNSEVQWGTSDVSYERELMNGGPPCLQAKTWTEQNPIRKAANFKTEPYRESRRANYVTQATAACG